MSDKAEELAQQLLNKTEGGKLQWRSVAEFGFEAYRVEIEDGYAFKIRRASTGDDKIIFLDLTKDGGAVLSVQVDNSITSGVGNAIANAALVGTSVILGTGIIGVWP